MKSLIVTLCAAALLVACNEATKTKSMPGAPKSIADVKDAIKGKKYKVANIGLLSPFASDSANPVNWKIQQEDTSKFFRDYAAKLNKFTLDVSADSTATFFDVNNEKTVKGVYWVDDGREDDEEKSGIKLRLKYSDSLEFGGTKTAASMTQTFPVKGVDAKELIVETGNGFNNRKVVFWLQAQ